MKMTLVYGIIGGIALYLAAMTAGGAGTLISRTNKTVPTGFKLGVILAAGLLIIGAVAFYFAGYQAATV